MFKRVKNIIPWISFVAILVAGVMLFISNANRTNIIMESPETKAVAEKVLNQITAIKPRSLDDQKLIEMLEQADRTPYIAQVWLFDADGKIVLSKGTPFKSETANQLATRQVKGALEACPTGLLSQEQQMMLLVGSAIQAEGEHNDVFRYQVRELRSPDNDVVGYTGITYDVNVAMSAKSSCWQIVPIIGLLLCLIIYWVGLSLWTYMDAKQHQERALVWALFVLIGNLVALIAYLLARNPTEKAANR